MNTGPCPKVPYLTQDEADTAARYLERKRGVRLRSDRCDHCGQYHLTKQGGSPKGRRAR